MSTPRTSLKLAAARGPAAVAATPLSCEAGEHLLRRGDLAALRAALQPLPDLCADDQREALSALDGWTLFWLGYVQQFEAQLLARRSWHEADRRFQAAGDERGRDLVACGLLHCMLMDNQSHDGIEEVMARVSRTTAGADDAGPLALYRAASRLLVAGETLDGQAADRHDVERVFAALSSSLDAETRLLCAAAAMHGIGRSMDHVQAADFHQAGAAVAALPEVRVRSHIRWQVFVSTARWHDPDAVPRLTEELAAAERLGATEPGHHLLAWSRSLRALHALTEGRTQPAREHLEAAHGLLDPAYPLDYALYHFVYARWALRERRYDEAAAHTTISLRKSEEGHELPSGLAPLLNLSGAVRVALGRFDEAMADFAQAAELSTGVQVAPCLCHLHLARGVQLVRAGAHAEARSEIGAGLAQTRSIDYRNFFGVLPDFAAEVCGAALDLEVDASYVSQVIAARALPCPDRGIARWPWPLRVRALGGFAIERDGEPFKFGRKAPKRLLDVLRVVVALGGAQVDAGRVASILWPDADGDEGRSALKAMLHRARSLLGPELLLVRDGQISFDAQAVWLDTWAFEHVSGRIESLLLAGAGADRADDGELARRRLQLLTLYRGNLLGEADVPAWALPARDRLRARFVRSVDLLGQRLERRGRADEAIALYRAALEQDNLAEELYQRLMECHLTRGEQAQALNAYRRCRELLSIVLGLKPSARTEALAARIAGR
jgi:DNA-binding SARP family transcriptional activator